jgi:hypothetical protein
MLAVDLDLYNNRVQDTLRVQKNIFLKKNGVKSKTARYDAREFTLCSAVAGSRNFKTPVIMGYSNPKNGVVPTKFVGFKGCRCFF